MRSAPRRAVAFAVLRRVVRPTVAGKAVGASRAVRVQEEATIARRGEADAVAGRRGEKPVPGEAGGRGGREEPGPAGGGGGCGGDRAGL